MRLIVAARKSELARIQAYMVGAALADRYPDLALDYRFRSSLGDRNQDDPLWEMPGQGVFTQDFRQDLIAGEVDMVVHSWKDLPTDMEGGTVLAATLARADHRDLLIVRRDAIAAAKDIRSLRILTSSPRRMHNLEPFLRKAFPGGLDVVQFEPVRGNIQTRLSKMITQDADGLVVAKAAMDRLLSADRWNRDDDRFDEGVAAIRSIIDECEWMVLPASHNPPAAAQGALAVEIAAGREDLGAMLGAVSCPAAFGEVTEERAFLASKGGGCHQKIGVWIKDLADGRVEAFRGQTDTGETLECYTLKPAGVVPSGVGDEQIFLPERANGLFRREAIAATGASRAAMAGADALMLATARIGDDHLAAIGGQIVWTSGVASWFKIAARGIWVNGTDDNLGAHANRDLAGLLGFVPKWLTMTHSDSPAVPALACYDLVPDAKELEVEGECYFFWRSGSAFKRALALAPEIREGVHACGPGRSLEIIRDALGPGARVFTFIGEDDWLGQIKAPKN